MYGSDEPPIEPMATDPVPVEVDAADEPTVESYLTPTVDFLVIVTVTIAVSVAAAALVVL